MITLRSGKQVKLVRFAYNEYGNINARVLDLVLARSEVAVLI